MLKSSLGFHTMTLFLPLDTDKVCSLLCDFYKYSHDTGCIIIETPYTAGYKATTKLPETIDEDRCFLLPLETIIRYRRDTGIRWRIISKIRQQSFSTCMIEVKINPKILSGVQDYISAATYADMETAIANFNREARKISSLLQDFSCYMLSRVDYCVNFSLNELAPECTPEQIINLIKRSDIPTSYKEWKTYDSASHRMKSKPGSFYLINNSIHINCYSKYMQLADQSQKNELKGYQKVPQRTLETAQDVIRFEVQCFYPKTYMLARKAEQKGNDCLNKYESLLDHIECIDKVSEYYKKTVGFGDWYTLEDAVKIVKNQHYNSQKERRLLDALVFVNQCRSVAKAKAYYQGDALDIFKKTLKDLSALGINPVTIPKEWGIKHIPNLLNTYFNKVDDDRLKSGICFQYVT